MAKKEMFLIRDGEGEMRTVMATSCRGAINSFLQKYPTTPGEELSVKKRGVGGWDHYTVR